MPYMKFNAAKATMAFSFYAAIFAASYIPAYATFEAINSHSTSAPRHLKLESASKALSWQEEINAYAERLADAYDIDPGKAKQFSAWILEASYESEQSPDLIASVIMTESSFRTNVTSTAGAVGPVQVRPKYWSEKCGNLNDPLDNIKCGAMVLRKYSEMSNGDVKVALKMYNVGPTNYKKRKLIAASNRYVTKIVRHLAMLDNPTVVIR